MASRKIRWGIIGCGDVTEMKSGPGFQKAQNSELVAVMRRNGDRAKEYADRHNVPKWYDSAEALINDPNVDAVYIATPPSSHKEYTLAVAAAGKPVYVEKPMALSYAECQEMIRACEKARVKLFTAYYRRAQPRFLRIRSWLDEEVIGTIQGVSIRFYQPTPTRDRQGISHWRIDPAIGGEGYFFDLASHMIDLIQYFLGPIISASGHAANREGLYQPSDTVSAAFMFEERIPGSGSWCFSAAENTDQTEIIGSSGKIVYSTFSDMPLLLKRNANVEEFIEPFPLHVQQPLIQTVVDDLLGIGNCLSTGESGARTSWVMDRVLGRI
jgi:predicted dehydrogenase